MLLGGPGTPHCPGPGLTPEEKGLRISPPAPYSFLQLSPTLDLSRFWLLIPPTCQAPLPSLGPPLAALGPQPLPGCRKRGSWSGRSPWEISCDSRDQWFPGLGSQGVVAKAIYQGPEACLLQAEAGQGQVLSLCSGHMPPAGRGLLRAETGRGGRGTTHTGGSPGCASLRAHTARLVWSFPPSQTGGTEG